MNNAVQPRVFALVAAGGTGGHVYPGIAVADALIAIGHPVSAVRFVTESRSTTTTEIANAGYAYDILALEHGLQRRFTVANVTVAIQFVRSVVQSLRLVRRHRPEVIVGFGAYITLPLIIAARLLRLPVLVHEQNAYPGLANRLAVRIGATAAVSIPATTLARSSVTGNPVRPEIASVVRRPQTPPLVAFVGGSLGAEVLDVAALGLYDLWRDRDDISIHHVSGQRSFGTCEAQLATLKQSRDRLDYRLVAYEYDMAGLYGRASLMVTRSGGSVAELAAAAMPAILVPWSGATERHQHTNAAMLAAAGAAVVVEESDCHAAHLGEIIDGLLADDAQRSMMSSAAHSMAQPDAAARVAQIAEAIARPRR